jgi:hypothetical protein
MIQEDLIMALTLYGDITPRTAAYVAVDLLKRAMPYLCLEKFGGR